MNLNNAWRRTRAKAGLQDVRLHDLSGTAASAAASIGLSLETVGRLLGDTQVATTKRYAFLFDDARGWAPSALHALLQNPLYRGEYIWNRSEWIKDHESGRRRRFERPESEGSAHRNPSSRLSTWSFGSGRRRSVAQRLSPTNGALAAGS